VVDRAKSEEVGRNRRMNLISDQKLFSRSPDLARFGPLYYVAMSSFAVHHSICMHGDVAS
jgi:hypothetical protein